MLKKVTLTDTESGRSTDVLIDTASDELALLACGKAPTEVAKVHSITGADEFVYRQTWKKPSMDDRVAFFAGFGRCLDRNISAIKSLELQTGRVKSPVYRGAIAEMIAELSAGEKLSDVFSRYPALFSDDVIALLRAGEESGRLPAVCTQIAHSQRKTLRILKKLKTGMIYPAIVLVLAVAVVIAMSFTLVPAISKLYISFKAPLPFATVALMWLSNLLLHQPYLAILPFVGLFFLFKNWPRIYRIPRVQRFIARLPTVGAIVNKSAATMSFRTLAMLLQSNVRISTALEITASAATHIDFRVFFEKLGEHITDGLSLPEAFMLESHRLGADGRIIAALMQNAAESGSATEALDELATDYEEELDNIASQIDKILEPITIVVMGVFVGFLVYAIYGPIFSLSKVVLPQKKSPAAQVAPARP
jgi:type II secretory pathway component PulF